MKTVILIISGVIIVIFGVLIFREISSRTETHLSLTTTPAKTEAYIGGQKYTTPIDSPFAAGTYSVQIFAPGSKPYQQNLRIRPNRLNRFTIKLEPEETYLPPEGSP